MQIYPGRIINDFIYPNKCQYAIPVYQRNYAWPEEQCRKLFDDIIQAYFRNKSHFCGSIVYALLKHENGVNYFVIVDGQQRLTTIYLLLKAMIDSTESLLEKNGLIGLVFNNDIFNPLSINMKNKLKLKPVKSDNQQLLYLMNDEFDKIEKKSGIWTNYVVFKNLISEVLDKNPDMTVMDIYKGLDQLICAKIMLESNDNAQEIFERINSFGVPLNLSDLIRNFVLMDDPDQDRHYEEYWIKIENAVKEEQMSVFFMNYLNFKCDSFVKNDTAYDEFKKLYREKGYTNESILQEILHYAELYSVFNYGSNQFGPAVNEHLAGLKKLDQTTVYLFLFSIFDDYKANIIDETILGRILTLLLNYSIRRIMCEVNSNSLRGLYKTLYSRIFIKPEYKTKENYYDAICSFMLQLSSRDVIPAESEFKYALIHNNLYRKYNLCAFLLDGIENQGKEKIITDNLTVEHVMPQNKDLSTAWQKMLGDNWSDDRDQWLHTLGNLTLTGYNSELGDKPFDEKKKLIEQKHTKVVILYEDIQNQTTWNATTIENRAKKLANMIIRLYPIEMPENEISFEDPRYKKYTAEDTELATHKSVSYYELIGERVNVDNFTDMVKSVAYRLYELDSSIIERMAKNEEIIKGWTVPVLSYDPSKFPSSAKVPNTDIYVKTGIPASWSMGIIKFLIQEYGLDIKEDFVYCARA